jgi:putative endonuclease
MSFYFFILYNYKTNRYYTGYCEDIITRVTKHNQGSTPSTRHRIPWNLVYSEKYESKTEAIIRERQIKNKKSRIFIEYLIKNSGN